MFWRAEGAASAVVVFGRTGVVATAPCALPSVPIFFDASLAAPGGGGVAVPAGAVRGREVPTICWSRVSKNPGRSPR